MGRKSTFSQETANLICERMATGMSLREICRAEGMPPESTVRNWAIADTDGFAAQYGRAREALVDRWAEEIIEISDDSTNDWVERHKLNGQVETVCDQEHINRSRLRVDSRKWLMSKVAPKKYGDRLELAGEITTSYVARLPSPVASIADWSEQHGPMRTVN